MQVTLGPNGKPVIPLTQRNKDNLERTYEFIDTCGGLTAFHLLANDARIALERLVNAVTGNTDESLPATSEDET